MRAALGIWRSSSCLRYWQLEDGDSLNHEYSLLDLPPLIFSPWYSGVVSRMRTEASSLSENNFNFLRPFAHSLSFSLSAGGRVPWSAWFSHCLYCVILIHHLYFKCTNWFRISGLLTEYTTAKYSCLRICSLVFPASFSCRPASTFPLHHCCGLAPPPSLLFIVFMKFTIGETSENI